ncbi:RecQ family ATP-dependent DNA helicase [Calditrichota bacterium LG25]
MDQSTAERLLKIAVGDAAARFREGQWEAIDALVNQRRKLLVVQRTGWGKSLVYFISTRILRDRGGGPTIIISPLLALMRNQIEAAERIGIRAQTINSTNTEEWEEITEQVLADQIDAILISPERLANESFLETLLLPIAGRVGLLVVDEAHCISDWGHDFRPDYKRLVNILRYLPPNLPLLGTTATANDRVIEDVRRQLGDIDVIRGPLMRKSLALQTGRLTDQAERLAWLAEHLPQLPGTGIVYVLTIRDAERVANWLKQQGIKAAAYYSGVEDGNFEDSHSYRLFLEEQFLSNRIKALVATSALGMGYDKPDVSFVIHYQAPASVISYYQQVGRAGRAIPLAHGVLLSGREDEEIHEYFRQTAFPPAHHVHAILKALEQSDGLSIRQLEAQINLRSSQIEKALKVLSVENPSPVFKDGSKWKRTAADYRINHEMIARLTAQREREWQEIQQYIDSDMCLMVHLARALDDPYAEKCGCCANCIGKPPMELKTSASLVIEAKRFLRHSEIIFRPRRQVATGAFVQYGFRGNFPQELRAEEGRILSRWGDAGWGRIVAENKHNGYFNDELVEAIKEMIELRWRPDPKPQWVTCIPSQRHPELVPDFARRLARSLKLPFVECIIKVAENEPQKLQQNRFYQCRNLDGVFEINDRVLDTPVLLVDDIIDSGWTMTVAAALLRQAGSGLVYPLALASTSAND